MRENIAAAILQIPPKQTKEFNWRKKKEYGQVPSYLSKMKEQEIEEYNEM